MGSEERKQLPFVEHLLSAQLCPPVCFTNVISDSHQLCGGQCYHLHFVEEETEIQRVGVTCPKSHSLVAAMLAVQPGLTNLRAFPPLLCYPLCNAHLCTASR